MDSADKTTLVSKLLSSGGQNKSTGPLIQEVYPAADITVPAAVPANQDEPTLLELMMQAQAAAGKSLPKPKQAPPFLASDSKKQSLNSGFKKGFFSQKSCPKQSRSDNNGVVMQSSDVIDVKKSQGGSNSLLLDDVQKAMAEDRHPILKELEKNG
jgi:hypothetical protein